MKKISDLKLTLQQFRWICEQTQSYKMIVWGAVFSKKKILEDQKTLHDIIYQAIDGWQSKAHNIVIQQKHSITVKFGFKESKQMQRFLYKNYDTKTTARLAALQWLAVQNGCKGE